MRAGKVSAGEEEEHDVECVRRCVRREEGAEKKRTRSRKMRTRHVVAGESGLSLPPVRARRVRGRGRHRSVRASRAPDATPSKRETFPERREIVSIRAAIRDPDGDY